MKSNCTQLMGIGRPDCEKIRERYHGKDPEEHSEEERQECLYKASAGDV